jgi:hypothetical protein
VTSCGAAAAVLQRKATAIVNVGRVIATVPYHFAVAVWRAKRALTRMVRSSEDGRPPKKYLRGGMKILSERIERELRAQTGIIFPS